MSREKNPSHTRDQDNVSINSETPLLTLHREKIPSTAPNKTVFRKIREFFFSRNSHIDKEALVAQQKADRESKNPSVGTSKTPLEALIDQKIPSSLLLSFVESCAAFLSLNYEHSSTIFNPKFREPFQLFLKTISEIRFSLNLEKQQWEEEVVGRIMDLIGTAICQEEESMAVATPQGWVSLGTNVAKYKVPSKLLTRFIENIISYDSFEQVSSSEGFKIKIPSFVIQFLSSAPYYRDEHEQKMVEASYIKYVNSNSYLVIIEFYKAYMTVRNVKMDSDGSEIQKGGIKLSYSAIESYYREHLAGFVSIDRASAAQEEDVDITGAGTDEAAPYYV